MYNSEILKIFPMTVNKGKISAITIYIQDYTRFLAYEFR